MTKISTEERNKKILDAYRNGTPAKILAREHNLSHGYVNHLAYNARVKYASEVNVKVGEIAKIASDIFKVSLKEIYSDAKNHRIVVVRFCIYFVARQNNFTYSSIARRMNKDHSTIVNGVLRAIHLIKCDESFKKMTEILTNAINETQTRTRCAGSD